MIEYNFDKTWVKVDDKVYAYVCHTCCKSVDTVDFSTNTFSLYYCKTHEFFYCHDCYYPTHAKCGGFWFNRGRRSTL